MSQTPSTYAPPRPRRQHERQALRLSLAFVAAVNEHDKSAMKALLAEDLDYVRPGGGRLSRAGDVIRQYERDWASLASTVEVLRIAQAFDQVFAEVAIHATVDGKPATIPGVVIHRWQGGRLINYRLYPDPLAQSVAATQPARD